MKSNGKWNWHKKSLLLLTLTATAGCVHGSTTPPPVNAYCKIAQPIRYNSKLDSPATVARIELHNSTWACLCDNDCPKSS